MVEFNGRADVEIIFTCVRAYCVRRHVDGVVPVLTRTHTLSSCVSARVRINLSPCSQFASFLSLKEQLLYYISYVPRLAITVGWRCTPAGACAQARMQSHFLLINIHVCLQ